MSEEETQKHVETEETEQTEEEWKPMKEYYKEKKYYTSPKLSEVYDRQRLDVPNGYYTKSHKIRTNEEIMSIWEAPVEDFELTEEEKQWAETAEQTQSSFRRLLFNTPKSPCQPHVLNLIGDKCTTTPDLGKTKKTIFQKLACDTHLFNLIECYNRHRKWHNARYNEIQKVLPGIFPELRDTSTNITRPISSYPQYKV